MYKSIIDANEGTSEELAGKGKSLTINPNSPLHPIADAITMSLAYADSDQSDYESPVGLMEDGYDDNDIEKLFDNVSDSIIKVIDVRRSVLYNTVLPVISSFTNTVVNDIGEHIASKKNEVSKANLNILNIPDMLSHMVDTGIINPHKGTTIPLSIPYRVSFGKMDNSRMLTAIKNKPMFGYGSTEWSDIISSFDEGMVSDILSTYFTILSNNNSSWEAISKNRKVNTIERNLIIFIISSFIVNNPPENTVAPHNKYEVVMGSINAYLTDILSQQYDMFSNRVKNGIIIGAVDQATKTVDVYGPVLDKYLSEGHSIDAVYAYSIGNGRTATIDQLVDNKEQLVKDWNRYTSMMTRAIEKPNQDILKTIVNAAFNKSMAEMTDAEKALIGSNGNTVEVINTNVTEKIANTFVPVKELEDYCMELVTTTRWAGHNIGRLLTIMDEINKSNDGLSNSDIVEVALFTEVVDYVVDNHIICESTSAQTQLF